MWQQQPWQTQHRAAVQALRQCHGLGVPLLLLLAQHSFLLLLWLLHCCLADWPRRGCCCLQPQQHVDQQLQHHRRWLGGTAFPCYQQHLLPRQTP